ncbi:MAG TPA: aldo/keto reductase family protein [Actinomycetota bacterium]
MRYRPLGRTGLDVSVISLGSWRTFGGSADEQTCIDRIHRAFELGVNFFDTADLYESGHAEEIVGRAIVTLPRDRVIVGTKVFYPTRTGQGLGRTHVLAACDESSRRLGLDVIDLYQCHRYDPSTVLEETCRVMHDLVQAGKIRHWGVSEWSAGQIADAVAICEREGLPPPATDQPNYSMLLRHAEKEVLPACGRLGLGVVVFSPLAQGVLTGKYRSANRVPPDSRAAGGHGAFFVRPLLSRDNFRKIDRLRPIASELGLTLGQLALAWILRRPEVTSTIVGATKLAQVEENVRAADVDLEAGTLDAVERALA